MSRQSRREVIVGLPAAAATLPALAFGGPAWARAADPVVPFVAIGDWGRDGASHQRDVARRMGVAAEEIGSRFVVSVGDNFYESGVRSAADPQWKTSFEDIYTAPSLQTPWYVALGNHDYRGIPQAQIDYAAGNPRWRMPSRYYKLAGTRIGAANVDIFVIDSSPLVHGYRHRVEGAIARNVATQDVAAQLAWLDRELGGSTAAWKIVVGHHTIYSGGSAHGNTIELIAHVEPLLERHGVQLYVNGHDHDLQHLRVGAVDYVCTGAGSEARPTGAIPGTLFALARSGFAAFKVGPDSLDLEFRDHAGASIYRAVIARARSAQARAA